MNRKGRRPIPDLFDADYALQQAMKRVARGDPRDWPKIVESWRGLSWDNGPDALQNLSIAYALGMFGLEPSFPESLNLYRKYKAWGWTEIFLNKDWFVRCAGLPCADGKGFYMGRNFMPQIGDAIELQDSVAICLRMADGNDAYGLFTVGVLIELELMEAGPNHKEEAFGLFEKASQLGYALATTNTGFHRFIGKGTEMDREAGLKDLLRAAEQGEPCAQAQYAELCLWSSFADDDPVKAVEFIRRSAEQGYGTAEAMLGECFHKGIVLEQNLDQARHWYQRAAEKYIPDALSGLRELG